MNKSEIVKKAYSRLSTEAKKTISLKHAHEFFTLCLHVIMDEVTNGAAVMLTGFGRFKPFHRKRRKGVHPQDSSKRIEIQKKVVPKFYASPLFESKVENGATKSNNKNIKKQED